MTWRELLAEGTDTLAAAGLPEASPDARELLFSASGMDLTAYSLRADEEASAETENIYRTWILRRLRHEPLQYITGMAPFYGYLFAVGPGVLIPRFDTETLVEALLPHLKPGCRMLDLCTGSGCILLACLLEGPDGVSGTGTDISGTALRYAGENADRLKVPAAFIKGDLFENVEGTFHVISANPPYIRTEDISALEEEVRLHEPRTALDGAADGLLFYRRIIAEAPDYLCDDGLLGLETGYDQAEDVMTLMRERGYRDICFRRDLGGLPRAVLGRRPVRKEAH